MCYNLQKKSETRCRFVKKALLAAALLLALALFPARGEDPVSSFDAFLASAYPGWTAESRSCCAPSAAAVLIKDGQKTLIVAEEENGAWKTVIDNPRMAPANRCTVQMDTDSLLYFSVLPASFYPYASTDVLDLQKTADGWRLKAVSERWLDSVGPDPDATPAVFERQCDLPVPGHWLRREETLSDENDNLLIARALPPLRDVLTKEETDLANLDFSALPFTASGYPIVSDGMTDQNVMRRLFEAEAVRGDDVLAAHRFLQGEINADESLMFLAEGADGQKALLCGAYEEDVGWVFTASSPLPPDAMLSYASDSAVFLPAQGVYACVAAYPGGKWGLDWICTADAKYIEAGPGWIAAPDESGQTLRPILGEHPWSDLTAIDWAVLPRTLEDARRQTDPAAFATPRSPANGLHLREKPEISARSLGEYYSGAPVRVLEKGKTWSRVRVGGREGYMPNQSLAFGKELRALDPILERKAAVRPVTEIRWQDAGKKELLFPGEISGLTIIGVTPDGTRWIVWDAARNHAGAVALDALCDGADG